jgi:heptosyltransferase-1
MIAGDTGPLHLAMALERPVVGLFGPTDPARTGPYGANARVLRHGSSGTDHSRRAETEEGLMQITVEEVVEAALELLRNGQDKVDA